MTGDSETGRTEEEACDPLANLSDAECEDLAAKIICLGHQSIRPRILQSAMEEVFYVVESARHELRNGSRTPDYRPYVAAEMHWFYSALENAIRSAREVERLTGYSGGEIMRQAYEE